MRSRFIILLSILTLLLSVNEAWSEEYTDAYLWLEEIEGEKALSWVEDKNKASLAVLKAQPMFEGIYQKALEILNSDERIAYPKIRGKYIYNFWQDENNERGIWRRTTLKEYLRPSPKWEILLDIDKLCQDEGEQWVFKGAAGLYPDYTLFMVYLSRGGSDTQIAREFDANSKEFVKDGFFMPESRGWVSWKDRDTIYVHTDFGEGSLTESGWARIAKRWKRGTPLSQAQIIFEGEKRDVSAGCYVINTPERQYEVIYRGMTTYTSHVYVIEDGRHIKLDIPEDANFGGFFKNQMLVRLKSDWTLSSRTYRQGSLISIDYDKYLQGDRAFSTIIEPDERSNFIYTYFSNFCSKTRNILLVAMLNNVKSELYKFQFKDGSWCKERINAPQFGTLTLGSTDEQSDKYFFTYESFLIPTSLYYVSDGEDMQRAKSLPDFFDSNGLEVKQLETFSKDGTRIPYFLVQPKGAQRDGSNPTLLYGYGGWEIAMLPRYSGVLGAAWLERGGTYVLANIRGGGEFGPKWHQAALKENRQRAFDDFIAVAEDLIKRKITSPRHLGITGGSNGGLLVGAVFTQRPELFNAVACMVPILDMRMPERAMDEYGNPDIPEEWAYLKKYSPYHNLSPDKEYPQVFFFTCTLDDHVHPGHARKMVAKMEDMGHKVYFYESMEGGHAGAVTNKQRALIGALIFTYLWMQLK
ncbi:hypothetical protein LCGC14_1656380 [marine sediment metagenome]|uniref:Peptidase S9 prolyl oligopeptidase catalytic domain-containing protein n=1 Tax=marine sediment metagenome TaxID=412755 RepID=A0A0F9HVY3_9ZZZZ